MRPGWLKVRVALQRIHGGMSECESDTDALSAELKLSIRISSFTVYLYELICHFNALVSSTRMEQCQLS